VKKPHQRSVGPGSSVPIGVLAERAAEALRQERFKEATELFKLAIRQDPRPEWKEALAVAYSGRARTMVAKKMFKEAAMVLENTLAADGTVREPRLYVACLIRDGQQPKAAAYLLRSFGREGFLPATERAELEDLAAALLVAVPQLPEVPRATPSDSSRWRELAVASREALLACISGASAEEMDRQLNRISLRSAFRPVRLLLKCLTAIPHDDVRTRQLLEAIHPGSAFYPFRQAVEAAVLGERVLDAYGWEQLTPAQQAFVAETCGLPVAASQFLARSSEAAQGGPAVLFNYLTKQPDLPQAEVRSACFNLLPQIPERVSQFEKSFGSLSDLERHRVKALAAETRNDWETAEQFWLAAAGTIADGGADRQAMLSQGVIYRHLARLADKYPEIEGEGFFSDPVIFYLERCYAVDPEHIPTLLDLMGRYRKESRLKDWHRVVDEAVQRFPEDSHVLLQATESAVARKAYKRAAGFARRLLKIDSINPGVRRQMIELQVAHARKQMRAKRPDLAAKELSSAVEWERSDAPSPLLRIARGLISLQTGDKERAEAWLREGVDLSGGGVAGWFQALLEAELMNATGGNAGWLRQELIRARETPPTKQAIIALVSAVGRPEARENKRVVAGLLLGLRAWLLQAAAFDWPDAEFQALAEAFVRFEAFDLLQNYARAARQRDPTNPAWRFHDIVARTKGNADRLSMAETDDLLEMADAAARREDFQAVKRIERFLDANDRGPRARGRAGFALPDTIDDDEMATLFMAMMNGMPKGAADDLRGLVQELGREAAVAQMVQQFRSSPIGPEMPEPLLRQLCEMMVAKAMDGSRSMPRGKARGSQLFDA
jgi:tetratricopeptide (TPR) repeat protein